MRERERERERESSERAARTVCRLGDGHFAGVQQIEVI
jgi:hypothetical protein